MKRIYLKPEAKVLSISLHSFVAISNQGGQTEYSGQNPEGGYDPIGGGDTPPPNPQGSRSWGYSMWDNME